MIGVLVSGEGTNLQALLDEGLPVIAVASNNREARGLARAEAANVATGVFPLEDFETREERDLAMADWLKKHGADVIACAGYMQLLAPAFLGRFPGRVVNIHPSLLPAFPGTSPIEDAIAAKAAETGVTVHYVDEGIDSGPIIAQEPVAIVAGDTTETLGARLHIAEHRLYPRVLRDLVA